MKFFNIFISTITLIFVMSSKSFAMPDMTNAFYDISFLNTKSETIKLNEYEDKILLVFFGYTHCPDICPSTLIDITKSLRELGDDAIEVQPVFISVDYLRDTPERLQKYMEFFDSRIIALTSSEDDLRDLFGRYGEVVDVRIITDRDSGRSKGFGFVEMSDDDQAKEAIEALDSKDFMGRDIRVNEARPREPRS